MAGNNSGLQSQSRNEQNRIVSEFRKGMVGSISIFDISFLYRLLDYWTMSRETLCILFSKGLAFSFGK